jgi:hypothetical protein
MMKKNNGNSGLYGRVTKKQMGGAAQPIGMIGSGIVAGRPPPDGGGMRTMDFRDKDKNGIDDRDEIQPGKKSPPMPGGRMPMPPGPMKPPQDPAGSGLVLPPRRNSPPKDQLNRQKVQTVLDRLRGSTPENQPGRPPSGSMSKFRDFIKNANADSSESGAPRLPGGGRLTPPVAGPDPDYREMRPRRFGGMGASIIEALGIKSGKMGDRSRNAPPRPVNTGGRRGRGRRK